MELKTETGHIKPLWRDEFKHFNYTLPPITQEEKIAWAKAGYHDIKTRGKMYDSTNPMPEWVSVLENTFGMYRQTYTFYRMDTMEVMPTHSDHYRTYIKLNNVEYDQVFRTVVMLEDWKPGHYFELDGVGYTNWKAGDWFKWKGDIPHAASNIGIEPRYTLQITGISVITGQLNELFCFDVPNITKRVESDHPMFKLQVFPALKKYTGRPLMVNLANGIIPRLKEITHDAEGIEHLNKEGLSIHLNEPLCSYLDDQRPVKHNHGFYSDFKSEIDYEKLRSDELDSILEYVERNNLTNVTVCSGDYNAENCYIHYLPKLKFLTDDIYLKTSGLNNDVNPLELLEGSFSKKFLCFNWRYTKHKNLAAVFVKFLAQEDAYVSWYFDVPLPALNKNLFFDLETWKQKHPNFYNTLDVGTTYVRDAGPLVLDYAAESQILIDDADNLDMWPNAKNIDKGSSPALFNGRTNSLFEFYNDSFLDVVTESRFAQPTANFSEKTFQPMQYFRPFIVFAPPYTLEYLKTFGFKTFSDFWDESYDTETCHETRLVKLFTLIQQIQDMPIERLKQMYFDMKDILEHNEKCLKSFLAEHKHKGTQ